MSSVIETEPAVAVVNYLWNRFGEEERAGGETSNTEMEAESFALTGGPLPTLHPRKHSLSLPSIPATSPFSSLGGPEESRCSGVQSSDLLSLLGFRFRRASSNKPLSVVWNYCCGPVVHIGGTLTAARKLLASLPLLSPQGLLPHSPTCFLPPSSFSEELASNFTAYVEGSQCELNAYTHTHTQHRIQTTQKT